jgi:hypothetical protein
MERNPSLCGEKLDENISKILPPSHLLFEKTLWRIASHESLSTFTLMILMLSDCSPISLSLSLSLWATPKKKSQGEFDAKGKSIREKKGRLRKLFSFSLD